MLGLVCKDLLHQLTKSGVEALWIGITAVGFFGGAARRLGEDKAAAIEIVAQLLHLLVGDVGGSSSRS